MLTSRIASHVLAISAVFAIVTASLGAQTDTQANAPDSSASATAPSTWTFGGWFAGGTHEPLKTRLGHKDDRALYILTLTASHTVSQSERMVVRYSPGVIPILIATGNRDYSGLDGCPPRDVCSIRTPDGGEVYPTAYRHTAYAAGIIPLSFDATAAITQHLGATIGLSGGGVYFDRVIPDPYAERFNFLADGNLGLRLLTRDGAVTVGFRLNHISNGNRGVVNPGMDSRLLYLAFER